MPGIEETYEAKRIKRALEEESEVTTDERALLPVKVGRSVKPSALAKKRKPADEASAENKQPEAADVPDEANKKPASFVDLYAEVMSKAAEKRRNIAVAASKVLENPQTEIGRLKEMQAILESVDIRCESKLWSFVAATMCELFKDILPSYHIRLATEAERKQRAKKETKQLRQNEEQMLCGYKRYLTYMEKYLPKKLTGLLKPYSVPKSAIAKLCCTVLRCFGELLVSRPTFNFSQNILRLIVPLMNSGLNEVSELACHYIETLFQIDKSQEVALEAVRDICRYVKKHKYFVRANMVRAFCKLRIREVDFDAPSREREEKKLRRLKFKLLSKKEQKRQKELDKVNKQLEAAGAVENEKRKLALQTAIVEQLFSVYFFVLKTAASPAVIGTDTPLLSAVLEGMAHFSKFMSIDYFDDLFRTFGLLLESGKLSPHESLNCIRSAFRMMQGDGESLDVDPARFYRHLYIILATGDFSRWPVDDFIAMLDCLDFMLVKRRKHLSDERLFAFAKRIATTAVSCAPDSAYAISLVALLRSLFGLFPSLDRLLDSSPYRPGGIFRSDVEDPEHCSAEGAFLYELSLLQSSPCSPLASFAAKFSREHCDSSKASCSQASQKKQESAIDLDAYCRMSPTEIFIRHSLAADLAAWEQKKDRDEKQDKTTKAQKKPQQTNQSNKKSSPKGPRNTVRPPQNQLARPIIPVTKKHNNNKQQATDSVQWNRKARRARRFGHNKGSNNINNGNNKNKSKNYEK